MSAALPRIALTTGEPAGIGPDICIQLAQKAHAADIVAIGDADLLMARARILALPLSLKTYRPAECYTQQAGQLRVLPVEIRAQVKAGNSTPPIPPMCWRRWIGQWTVA